MEFSNIWAFQILENWNIYCCCCVFVTFWAAETWTSEVKYLWRLDRTLSVQQPFPLETKFMNFCRWLYRNLLLLKNDKWKSLGELVALTSHLLPFSQHLFTFYLALSLSFARLIFFVLSFCQCNEFGLLLDEVIIILVTHKKSSCDERLMKYQRFSDSSFFLLIQTKR